MVETLEGLYNLKRKEVELTRVRSPSGKWLELFGNPAKDGDFTIEVTFPEFTCLCPRTSQPDFATIFIKYIPDKYCVELKSLKYYLNSFRNEGHFHEEVTNLIYGDLEQVLTPKSLYVEGRFNVRGGTHPVIKVGKDW